MTARHLHWNGQKGDSDRDATNDEKHVSHALARDPTVEVKGQAEGEEILDKVHDGKSLSGLLTMAVHHVGDDGSGPQLDAQVDQAEADHDGDGPRGSIVCGLSPTEESGGGEEDICHHDGEAELGFLRQHAR